MLGNKHGHLRPMRAPLISPLTWVGLAFRICRVEPWKETRAKLPSGTTVHDSFVWAQDERSIMTAPFIHPKTVGKDRMAVCCEERTSLPSEPGSGFWSPDLLVPLPAGEVCTLVLILLRTRPIKRDHKQALSGAGAVFWDGNLGAVGFLWG